MSRARRPASVTWARVIAAAVLAVVALGPAAGPVPVPAADADEGRQLAPPAAADVSVHYGWPGSSTVLRRFDPPATEFGVGHRGVDLAVPDGAPVRAAADGIVTFAGNVAGTGWVSIAHADGVTTSYGPVTSSRVGRGDRVVRGQTLAVLEAGAHGQAGGGLHWGARRGDRYVDPLGLLVGRRPRPSLTGGGEWTASDHAVRAYEPWQGARWGGLGYHPSPTASEPGYAVPPNANHLVLVAGLGTSSESVPIDADHLGYDPDSITSFSYAGMGEDPGARGRAEPRPYGAEDTWDGVEVAARRLGEQLRAQQRREPGRAVDLVGHSLGGVVIATYLAHHHDPYDRELPPIGHVVTIASPLQGSDVASLASDLHAHRLYGRVAAQAQEQLRDPEGSLAGVVDGLPPLDARTIADLRVGSPVLDRLRAGMDEALERREVGPLAMGTRVLTIGGGTDPVVGAGRSSFDSAVVDDPAVEHRVLPGGHSRVLQTEAVREAVWRFLADDDVVESPGHLSGAATWVAGHLVRYAGWRLEASDRRWAPVLPPAEELVDGAVREPTGQTAQDVVPRGAQ